MNAENYVRSLNTQLTYLFSFASKINEIDTAASIFSEFRGMQDEGWNTVATAHEVFKEFRTLTSMDRSLTTAEYRQLLCLYAHLAEAGGVYEGLINILNIPKLKPYNLWPFQDLVRVRQKPQAVIGPNANLMFRRLATTANEIGMPGLSKLLEITFSDDIRNAIAHADYILVPQGLRIRRRNGGNPITMTYIEVETALQIGLYFFELLHHFQTATAQKFQPARNIIGRFSANFPMLWKLELKDDGSFSISGDSPGPQSDPAFERQEKINNLLGGKVLAIFRAINREEPADLLHTITSVGFEPLIVEFDTSEQLDNLLLKINDDYLWYGEDNQNLANDGLLIASPLGFKYISSSDEFQEMLPVVEEIEFS